MLSDLIADSDDEISAVTFGTGFAGITDLMAIYIFSLMIEKQKDKEVSTGYYLQAKECFYWSSFPTTPDTVAPPVADEGEAETEENAEDEADGNSDDNNDGEDQNENSDEFHNALH